MVPQPTLALLAEPPHTDADPDVTVVMPCLNEARTLAACVRSAQDSFLRAGLRGEVIVADNGSSDGSVEIAEACGARVVLVPERGYGNALRHGIAAARAHTIVMGDADQSYDFDAIPSFVLKLDEGYDLVMGDRFRGGIAPNAMPWSHRYIGNPVLSGLGRLLFHSPVRDFHCGLRAFTRDAFDHLHLGSPGMEFASEMVIRASLCGLRVAEVPTALRKDGRDRPPHLRTWRDGWRHLRFMLLYSPRWLFLIPGLVLVLAGAAASAWLVASPRHVGRFGLDVNTLLVASTMIIVGYQSIVFAVCAKVFAIREGLHPPSALYDGLFRLVRLETGLTCGFGMVFIGVSALGVAFHHWSGVDFGSLDARDTMRITIPSVTVLAIGVETIFASLFLSVLGIAAARPQSRYEPEAAARLHSSARHP